MKVYIFVPEPQQVETIPPQLGAEVPIAIVGDGKAVVIEGEWRSVQTPDEAGRIQLVWGYYYHVDDMAVYLNVNDAPDPLLAYFVASRDGDIPLWYHDWTTGRMNVYFRPSELGDAERARAKYARVAEKRRQLVESLKQNPNAVMQMLVNK